MKKTKKLLLLFAVIVTALACFALSASAKTVPASGNCGDNVYWAYDESTGELVISGTGAMTDYESDGLTSTTPFLFSDIESVVIENGVTTIGNYAFSSCHSLTEVTIPDSVTTIGDYAFAWCDSLTEVTIPDSVTTIGDFAFYYCKSLMEVTIPDSVTTIGDYAFAGDPFGGSGLTKVTIGNSVTTIGSGAFDDCDSLTDVYYGGTQKQWSKIEIAQYNNYLINSNIHYASCYHLDENADKFCDICEEYTEKLYKSGKCGDNVTYERYEDGMVIISGSGAIWDYAASFDSCDSPFHRSDIKSVVIESGITTIGNNVFYNCDSLTSVTIGNSVTTIGNWAFRYCDSLSSVTIPDSVTTIGISAFQGCDSLTVDKNNRYYCNDEYGVLFNKNKTELVQYPIGNARTAYVIPDSVTTIEDYAFQGCDSLTSVTIPDSVTTIGEWAFCDCDSLTSVTIGNSVTTIGNRAFFDCDSLTSVAIPDSVTTIGFFAFDDCNSLTDIFYYGTEEQWKKISIHGLNDNLFNATIHYNTVPFEVPASVTVTQSTSAIKLTWSTVKDATGYRVFINEDDVWKTVSTGKATSYLAENLTAGTKYTYAVRAYVISDGKATWAPEFAIINTATKAVAPAKVASAQNETAIKLAWAACPGATGYRIYYKSGNTWKVCVSTTSLTTHTFTGLKAGAKYTFAIRPYILADGAVIWSDYTQFMTATKPATVSAKVTSPSKGKITLTWNKVDGDIDGYRVYYKVGNGNYQVYKNYTKAGTLNFSNLKSGTKYTFAVRAGIRTSGGNIFGGYTPVTVTVK